MQDEYELIDSGDGRKLERYGAYVLSRPDPQAIWRPSLPREDWAAADAVYTRQGRTGRWDFRRPLPRSWPVAYAGLVFVVRPTEFKHTGLFPEQAANWRWFRDLLSGRRGPSVLNLFAYTGGATLSAAAAGASVCHVDAAKGAIRWARENQERSGLSDRPIRWIRDDVPAFVAREKRRGRRYDALILDPPPYGRGPDGQMWKLERDLAPLLDRALALLSEEPAFVLINGYATGYSHHSLRNLLLDLTARRGGRVESGDLLLPHRGSVRMLPCGIFARWTPGEGFR